MASVYDLQLLKDFIYQLAYGIKGNYDNLIAGQGSVEVAWKRFTTRLKRNHNIILGNITLSVINVRRLCYIFPPSTSSRSLLLPTHPSIL